MCPTFLRKKNADMWEEDVKKQWKFAKTVYEGSIQEDKSMKSSY